MRVRFAADVVLTVSPKARAPWRCQFDWLNETVISGHCMACFLLFLSERNLRQVLKTNGEMARDLKSCGPSNIATQTAVFVRSHVEI